MITALCHLPRRCSQVIRASVYCPASSGHHCHLSSLHAIPIWPLSSFLVTVSMSLGKTWLFKQWWWDGVESPQSSLILGIAPLCAGCVVWPPAVRLIILSLTKRRHINFYSDPESRSIIRLAWEPGWLVVLAQPGHLVFISNISGNGSVSCARLTPPWSMSCITPDGAVLRFSILFRGSWNPLQIMLAQFDFWWISPQHSGNWPKPSELFTQATIFRDVVFRLIHSRLCSIFPKCIKIFFGWLNIPR